MKSTIALTALALLVTPALAHDLDSDSDRKQGILNVHDSHFPHAADDDHAPAKGGGDSYGSVLLDKDSHTPHKTGDSHEPEMGKGDAYGSVLLDVPKK